jgi:hypothetical protein
VSTPHKARQAEVGNLIEAIMRSLILATALLSLLAASTAQADIGPPKNSKIVTLDWKITTEKEYPDYVFYTSIGNGKNGPTVTAVKFDPKNPIEIKGAGRTALTAQQASIHAVPKDAEKNYKTEKEFLAAIGKGKVEGQLKAKSNFGSTIPLRNTDPRTSIVIECKVEKLDAKEGIVLTLGPIGEAQDPAKKDPDKKDPDKKNPAKQDSPPDEEDTVVASAPRGGVWIAGLAATLALVFAGLWLAGRRHPRAA